MRDDPTFHVRGHVSNATTRADAAQAIAFLYPAASNLDVRSFIRYPKLTSIGEFDIDRVPAGQYILRIQALRELNAQVEIRIQDRDIDDLEVLLRPGVHISARITMDATDPQQLAVRRPPELVLSSTNPAFAGEFGAPQDDGTYLFSNVGPWVLRPLSGSGMPAGMFIKSVRFSGDEITDSEHGFTSGGNMDVTLSTRAAEVSGILKDCEGKPLAGITVSLWRSGAITPGLFFPTCTARTDANGAFRIQSVPPGDYRVAAWEEIPQGADLVPEFRVQFDSVAKAVRLVEDARETVEPIFMRRWASEDTIARLR